MLANSSRFDKYYPSYHYLRLFFRIDYNKVKLLLHDFSKDHPEPIGSLRLVRPFLLCFSLYQPLGRGKVKFSFAQVSAMLNKSNLLLLPSLCLNMHVAEIGTDRIYLWPDALVPAKVKLGFLRSGLKVVFIHMNFYLPNTLLLCLLSIRRSNVNHYITRGIST